MKNVVFLFLMRTAGSLTFCRRQNTSCSAKAECIMCRKARIIIRAAKNIIPPKAVSDAKRSFRNVLPQAKHITPPTGGISLAAGEYNILPQAKYITAADGGTAAA